MAKHKTSIDEYGFDLEQICDAIASGQSLASVAADYLAPETSLRTWLRVDETRSALYSRAREDRAHKYADEVVTLADGCIGRTNEVVQATRLAVDTRKWVAAKLYPKTYGERITQEIDARVEVNQLTDEQIQAKLQTLLTKVLP